ncbi:MAG: hypothetical protein R3E13_09585 [Alphaproteobacteria bacterium]
MNHKAIKGNFLQEALHFAFAGSLGFNKSSRKLLSIALCLAANDAGANGVSAYHMLRQANTALANQGLMRGLFHLINQIDDIVDEMSAEKRLSMGVSSIGKEPCEFLQNPNVCVPAYHGVIKRMSEQGVLSYEEEVSFSNLYAVLIQEGAHAEIDYLASYSVADRQKMTEANLKLCEVLRGHLLQHYVAEPEVTAIAKNEGLSHADVCRVFPKASKLGRMGEMVDDLEDFLTDFEHEVTTGIPSPNSILCKLHEAENFCDSEGQVSEVLLNFLRKNQSNPDVIQYENYPDILKQAITSLGDDYFEKAYELGMVHRDFMVTWWRATLQDGMRSSANHDVISKSTRHEQEAAAATKTFQRDYG